MADEQRYTIGAEALCSDGSCGRLTQVVVDPVREKVTHLVVEPAHRVGLGRLVPLRLVADATVAAVTLSCTTAEFERLDGAEETRFIPGLGGGYGGYPAGQALAWPYFPLGPGSSGLGLGNAIQPEVVDALPDGEVAIHRGDPVHATDGDAGRVQGLVVDTQSGAVTHVLLQEGHLWGKRQVAIPAASITGVEVDGIHVGLSRDAIGDLDEVSVGL